MRPSSRQTDPPPAMLAPDPTRMRLSPREREVALLVADGLTDRLIARRLGLTPSSVAVTIQRIRVRLGLEKRRHIAPWVQARREPGAADALLRRADAD